MDAAVTLRRARRRAGLSQRELAAEAGTPQPTIARIERGHEVPRVDTLDRLLRACLQTLDTRPTGGAGVDRTLIREMLRLTPEQRLRRGADAVVKLDEAIPTGVLLHRTPADQQR
jgi:transcriptional regulator with XRE-family HTH domain